MGPWWPKAEPLNRSWLWDLKWQSLPVLFGLNLKGQLSCLCSFTCRNALPLWLTQGSPTASPCLSVFFLNLFYAFSSRSHILGPHPFLLCMSGSPDSWLQPYTRTTTFLWNISWVSMSSFNFPCPACILSMSVTKYPVPSCNYLSFLLPALSSLSLVILCFWHIASAFPSGKIFVFKKFLLIG